MHEDDVSDLDESQLDTSELEGADPVVEIVADDGSWTLNVSYTSAWDDIVPGWRDALAKVGHILSLEIVDCLQEAGTLAPVDIDIRLTSDEIVRSLNSEYRDKDVATNVLSFATWWDDECPPPPAEDVPVALGDLAIALETVQREAEADGKTVEAHFIHLVIHGILHLIGFDHVDDADAEHMEGLETDLLAVLGIANPYVPSELADKS